MGFVNTVDLLGEDQTMDQLLTGDIERYVDDRQYDAVNDSIFREQNHLSAIIMPRAPAGYCYMTKQLVLLDTNLTKFNRSMMLASCTKLRALVLRNTDAVAQLDPTYTKFTVTAIAAGNGYVYVPRALVEDYKVATNWSAYADQIRAIEDYTEDGTLDGPMDETKI